MLAPQPFLPPPSPEGGPEPGLLGIEDGRRGVAQEGVDVVGAGPVEDKRREPGRHGLVQRTHELLKQYRLRWQRLRESGEQNEEVKEEEEKKKKKKKKKKKER